ncbi:hypothetical protein HQ865_16030 [Mucilaginibacter mali]|uniref:DUF3352 domain-containing protein n=1 Tax=Mucilaginibacter mali TaxID=2740462 RepID=A0A7D4UPV2_9SPHI|nr:hypothetical protein [Mucilaginibacter mali]QKJ31200.1 hypothetical protein HQ865_16030 [Mucilaginibacter mali]
MRKLIITTLILLIATVAITVVYFKNLNPPAAHTAKVMQNIPNTAALIFDFANDNGFYDIFDNNKLLNSLIGDSKMKNLSVLRDKLLNDPLLKNFFTEQHIYISLHGEQRDSIDFLITVSGGEQFSATHLDQLAKQKKSALIVSEINLGGKEAYNIYLKDLKKRFYLVNLGNHILSGSFSKDLATQSAQYKPGKNSPPFVLVPDQQNSNSLANLYVNYGQLNAVFDQFFLIKNYNLLKPLRNLPALGALTLNYKSDALMFNGFSTITRNQPLSYLNAFVNQQPVEDKLKDIFPSTTAVSSSFALSDTKKFVADLSQYHAKAGLTNEKTELFKKVKSETGVQLDKEFAPLLAGEFAMLTTRFDEKLAIVALKDGSAMRPLMVNISTMSNDNVGQFKFNKLPFFLLGDAFSILNHPYFMILDNNLILANSVKELDSYKDSYLNHKFLSKTSSYTEFDNLMAERCNVAFFLHFRNMFPILKRDMKPAFVTLFNTEDGGPNKFYALSWQFSASDLNFYTNFCIRLNHPDSTSSNN